MVGTLDHKAASVVTRAPNLARSDAVALPGTAGRALSCGGRAAMLDGVTEGAALACGGGPDDPAVAGSAGLNGPRAYVYP